VAAVLVFWAFWWEPRQLITRAETVHLPCWSGAPVRVALIADIHAGSPFIDESKLDRLVTMTNAAHPDAIVLLGDYVVQDVVGGHFIPPETTARILRRLHAPAGVFAVIGNHDWWLDAPRVTKAFEANGIRVLEDDAAPVTLPAGRFWFAGVSDYWEGKHDVARALSHVTDDAPTIVLTHNPDIFPNIPPRACLTLSGHTHGGQVALPIFGRRVVPSKYGERYAVGHVVEGGRHLVVTSGVGTSIIPVRFRVPPEIVILTISK